MRRERRGELWNGRRSMGKMIFGMLVDFL